MDSRFGKCDDDEVYEDWLKAHRDIYEEQNPPETKSSKRRRSRKDKRNTPPPIKVRAHRVRPCPSCKIESLSDTIRGGMCLGCQVSVFFDSI